MTTCIKCHRALSDPESIAAGMGPICRRVEAAEAAADLSIWQYRPELGPLFGPEGKVILAKADGIQGGNVPWSLTYHSPSGLRWGYQGSGPADLALNILYAILVYYGWQERHKTAVYEPSSTTERKNIPGTAFSLHQTFKRHFLSADDDRIEIPTATIIAWMCKTLTEDDDYERGNFFRHMHQKGFDFDTGTWKTA